MSVYGSKGMSEQMSMMNKDHDVTALMSHKWFCEEIEGRIHENQHFSVLVACQFSFNTFDVYTVNISLWNVSLNNYWLLQTVWKNAPHTMQDFLWQKVYKINQRSRWILTDPILPRMPVRSPSLLNSYSEQTGVTF